MNKKITFIKYILPIFILFLVGCSENQSIVNQIDEREANEIVVFLASKGIEAQKIQASVQEAAGGGAATILWNIAVAPDRAVEAMALLNQNGLPRIKGTTLLELFAKGGLMTSDKEETIRYQAGVEEELTNIIRKIDGVLDADVQISFPTSEELTPGGEKKKIKAAVYVKHQGVFDDPNNHLETKVKRLLSGSIDGLDFENVSVVSDRARLANVKMGADKVLISGKPKEKNYVSIWSIIMTKGSLARFRMIFFFFICAIIVFAGTAGWLIYRFYPQLKAKKTAAKEEEQEKETEEKT